MASKKKLLQAAAGSAGGGATTDVDDVFSTFLYDGNGSVQKIENGIQLGAASTDNVALHMTGATSTDNGPLSLTVNSIGNATTSTTQTKFTSKSLYVDGTGSGDLTTCFDIQEGQIKLAKKDFTIEYWVYHNAHNSYADFGSWNYYVNGYNGNFGGGIGGSGTQLRLFKYDGQSSNASITATVSTSLNTWYHVAISRSNGTVYLFLDGTLKGSGAFDHDLTDAEIGGITLGKLGAYEQVNAYFSDFRITVGAARYTSSFTAPSAALPVDSGTSGEGGLVWTKSRSDPRNHSLHDSARGVTCLLKSNGNNAQYCDATQMVSFNANGFTVGSDGSSNTNGDEYVSWTWRKTPKFFDVVTYTGNGVSGRSISHNLNGNVGMILFKRTDSTSNWIVWHRSAGGAYGFLDVTDAFTADSGISNPTTTAFTIESTINAGWNASGGTYVAYLFAHNNSDGEFGPDGDADIIKCGGYTGNGTEQDINLGFEAQWVMIKRTDGTGRWFIFDSMRGVVSDGNDAYLRANGADIENTTNNWIKFTPTGFTLESGDSEINGGATPYIYMAIRRGPLAEPTSATDVFAVDTNDTTTGDPTKYDSTFTVDMVIQALNKNTSSSNKRVNSRLTGINYLTTNSTAAEGTNASSYTFDTQTGFRLDPGTDVNDIAYMWKRAPSYFDVVAYSGTQVARTISHNLGLNGTVPEMIWVKNRDGTTPWMVYHSALGNQAYLQLNSTAAAVTGNTSRWNATTPTASVFSLGDSGSVNGSGTNYIAYLFSTLAGVSKCGSYTGNGNTGQTIDCGFSNGARFVLIKRTDTTGSWYVHDTERGIVAGNDPYLMLDTSDAETTGYDLIDPHSSGFSLATGFSGWNANGGSYIFYAIA